MIRTSSVQVGKLAIEAMEIRTRKWRSRRDKDPALKQSRVGSAVEIVSNEKIECEYDIFSRGIPSQIPPQIMYWTMTN